TYPGRPRARQLCLRARVPRPNQCQALPPRPCRLLLVRREHSPPENQRAAYELPPLALYLSELECARGELIRRGAPRFPQGEFLWKPGEATALVGPGDSAAKTVHRCHRRE